MLSTVIRDVDRFEYDMVNDVDMEAAIRTHQGMLDISRDRQSPPRFGRAEAGNDRDGSAPSAA